MAFPNLVLLPDVTTRRGVAQLWAQATGVPDNGLNTFEIPFVDPLPGGSQIDPDLIFNSANSLKIIVTPLAPGVSGVVLGSPLLSADKRFMTLNFTADGIAQATVLVRLFHSLEH